VWICKEDDWSVVFDLVKDLLSYIKQTNIVLMITGGKEMTHSLLSAFSTAQRGGMTRKRHSTRAVDNLQAALL
jgi:hypothetical protein